MGQVNPSYVMVSIGKELRAARTRYIKAVRGILDSRTVRCDDKCPGWFISADDGDVERCDECALLNGYGDMLTDDDCGRLPEAIRQRDVMTTAWEEE